MMSSNEKRGLNKPWISLKYNLGKFYSLLKFRSLHQNQTINETKGNIETSLFINYYK